MSIFANVAPITSVQADTIRTGKFTLDSNVYPAVIKMAFMEDSKSSQARGVKFEFAINVEGKTRKHYETIWIAGKDGKFTKPDGKPTFGMEQLDNIAKLTLGTGVQDLETTTLQIEVKKGEALQPREVFRALCGQKVMIGLKEINKNKQAKVNQGGKEVWVDVNEARLENSVDKYFNADGKTLAEIAAGTPAVFIETWKENFAGKLDDRFKPVAGAPMGAPAGVQGAGVASGSLI